MARMNSRLFIRWKSSLIAVVVTVRPVVAHVGLSGIYADTIHMRACGWRRSLPAMLGLAAAALNHNGHRRPTARRGQ